MKIVAQYQEVAFALAVTGAAMMWPPLALIVAALFFVVLAALEWREVRKP